jgi:molybdenum cofactor biosynthesis protein B
MSHSSNKHEFVALNIAVLTVSDSRTEQTDKSGKLLADRLSTAGHRLAEKLIVPDDIYRIRAVVAGWIAADDVDAVITTGGTGVTGRDDGTYIFCVPGSSGACATAWDELISAQLDIRTQPCNLSELMPRLLER